MSDYIDTRVTPSLHPDNVKEIDGYDEQTAPVLAPTMTAFDTAYQAIGSVHDAREAAKTNPTWNEAQVVIETDNLARRKMDHVTRTFDAVHSNLAKGIAHIEAELTAPVKAKAAAQVAGEIRSFMRTMDTGERHEFIRKAVEKGDADTVSSALGAPSYLSGLTDEFQALYTRMWHEKTAPEMAKRLKVMQGARDMIQSRAGLVFGEFEKAVGCPPAKAARLKAAKTASERHFVMTRD